MFSSDSFLARFKTYSLPEACQDVSNTSALYDKIFKEAPQEDRDGLALAVSRCKESALDSLRRKESASEDLKSHTLSVLTWLHDSIFEVAQKWRDDKASTRKHCERHKCMLPLFDAFENVILRNISNPTPLPYDAAVEEPSCQSVMPDSALVEKVFRLVERNVLIAKRNIVESPELETVLYDGSRVNMFECDDVSGSLQKAVKKTPTVLPLLVQITDAPWEADHLDECIAEELQSKSLINQYTKRVDWPLNAILPNSVVAVAGGKEHRLSLAPYRIYDDKTMRLVDPRAGRPHVVLSDIFYRSFKDRLIEKEEIEL